MNHNQLFHNNGDGTFTDVTEKAGVAAIHPKLGKTWSTAAGWFDYDNDGRLDLFVTNYVNWSLKDEPLCNVGEIVSYCSPDAYTGQPNMLFHNIEQRGTAGDSLAEWNRADPHWSQARSNPDRAGT